MQINTTQSPTVGRIVLYKVPEAEQANYGPVGATLQSVQNKTQVLPAVIVNVWSETCVNLKVLNDGVLDWWKTSVSFGDQPGQWSWPSISPVRVQITGDGNIIGQNNSQATVSFKAAA